MKVTSIFNNNSHIPAKYSCEGENINPSLFISEISENAKSIAIIMEDQDSLSKIWTHWITWNIPVSPPSLKIDEDDLFEFQGRNDFGKISYIGPCPPRGSGIHRYFFKVYALDENIELKFGSSKEELEKAMQNHILAKAEIIGLYSRN